MVVVPEAITVIGARLGSKRFPRKVLEVIAGEPMLARVVREAKKLGHPVILFVPPKDRELIELCEKRGWPYCTAEGDGRVRNDVLGPFYWAAALAGAGPKTKIFRVTADCPDVHIYEIFSFAALEEAYVHADSSYDREHVTPYMERRGLVTTRGSDTPKRSIDTPDELDRYRRHIGG